MAGASFCVSFADPRQVEDAIRLVGEDGIVLLDNGAFTIWRKGSGRIDRVAFWKWANEIQARSRQAIAVVPDVIGGTEEENREEIELALGGLARFPARTMGIYHLNESLDQANYVADRFHYFGIGSSGDFDVQTRRAAFRARVINLCQAARLRLPGQARAHHIHLMRGLGAATEVSGLISSADSTNVARNHCRYRGAVDHVRGFADRVEGRIQRFEEARERLGIRFAVHPRIVRKVQEAAA
jgi:hypothetical protein